MLPLCLPVRPIYVHTQPGPHLCCIHVNSKCFLQDNQTRSSSGNLSPSFQVRCIALHLHIITVFISYRGSQHACCPLPCPSACALLHLQPTVHLWQSSPFWSSSWIVSHPTPKLVKCLPTLSHLCCSTPVVLNPWIKTPHYLMEMQISGSTHWVWVSGITVLLKNQCPANKVQAP